MYRPACLLSLIASLLQIDSPASGAPPWQKGIFSIEIRAELKNGQNPQSVIKYWSVVKYFKYLLP